MFNINFYLIIRARNCDPKSSFGDFIAVNSNVDITLANVLRPLVCDGIIAPSYDKEALNIAQKYLDQLDSN